MGSETLIAREYDFRHVYGTEVDKELVSIADYRIKPYFNFCILLYDGARLPYQDSVFTSVVSGHIIEHTISPFFYLKEHLRVISQGGLLFQEFPNRYHPVELHTGLPSLEFLLLVLRNIGLCILGSHISPVEQANRLHYRLIAETLHPMSRWQILLYIRKLRKELGSTRVIHSYHPIPGYVRIVLRKNGV